MNFKVSFSAQDHASEGFRTVLKEEISAVLTKEGSCGVERKRRRRRIFGAIDDGK